MHIFAIFSSVAYKTHIVDNGIYLGFITTYICVMNDEKCFDQYSFSDPFTIQNVGTVDEHDLYTFQFSSGNYLMVTKLSYQSAR